MQNPLKKLKDLYKKLKKKNSTQTLIKSAAILMIASLIGKVLGFLRIKVLASTFGASGTLDAYNAAFNIFDAVYKLTMIGVVFVPIFIKIRNEKKAYLWKFVSSILNIIIIFYIIFAFFIVLFTPNIVKLLFPKFVEHPDQVDLTVKFIRIMLIQPLILSISGITGGILHSYKKFLAYAAAPLLYNLGIILGALYLVDPLGPEGLGWGVVIGAALFLLIQIPSLAEIGFKYSPTIKWKSKELKKTITLSIPRILALLIDQFNIIVISSFASGIALGSISIFKFAQSFQDIFIGLLGISIATVLFPTLSENVAKKDFKTLKNNIIKSFGFLVFVSIPVTGYLAILSHPIINTFIGGGSCDAYCVDQTANTLAFLSIGIASYIITPMILRVYYAIQDTRTPLITGSIAFILNLTLCYLFVNKLNFGITGLALSYSLVGIIKLFALVYILQKRKHFSFSTNLQDTFSKTILITAISIILTFIAFKFGNFSNYVKLIVTLIVGGGSFSFMAYKLHIKEFHFIWEKVNKAFMRNYSKIFRINNMKPD